MHPTPSVSTHSHLRNPFARHQHLPRRRSLDNPAEMVNPQSRSSSPTRKQEVQYPRGGRQIGAEPPKPLSRSNSGEHRQNEATGSLPISFLSPLSESSRPSFLASPVLPPMSASSYLNSFYLINYLGYSFHRNKRTNPT